MKKKSTCVLIVALALLSICLLAIGTSAIINRRLPTGSQTVEVMSASQKALMAEALHLRRQLGNTIWDGWGDADIPMIAFNESYAFITGYPEPPDGWVKIPQGSTWGGPWEIVPGEDFLGERYYHQALLGSHQNPQAFAVQVGDRLVSSLGTKEWMEISLRQPIENDLPPFLRAVFPYQFMVRLLLSSSDLYISAVLHESFHAFQGMTSLKRLAEAENIMSLESAYPWQSEGHPEAWREELVLLAKALEAPSDQEARELASQFLAARRARRENQGLSASIVDFERQREWLEGLAKYTELAIWEAGSAAGDYQPLPEVKPDPDFHVYQNFGKHWSQEVDQLARMASQDDEGRFYYTGMAQAFLLDRFYPEWKSMIWEEGAFIEDLLVTALDE